MMLTRATEIASKIAAEGVRATTDSREAGNPPVVLVGPPRITRAGQCVAEYEWPIYALAPRPADSDVLNALDGLLDAITSAGFFVGIMQPTSYPTAAGELAAYQVTYLETIGI